LFRGVKLFVLDTLLVSRTALELTQFLVVKNVLFLFKSGLSIRVFQ